MTREEQKRRDEQIAIERVLGLSEWDAAAKYDGGESWQERAAMAGLVVWRTPRELILIDGEGSVHASVDGRNWRDVGTIGGQPAAFESERDGLYVALHDGTIKHSGDGGESWSVRTRP